MNTPANLSPQWEALTVEASRLCPAAPVAAIREAAIVASRAALDPDALSAVGYGTPARPSPLALIFGEAEGVALVQGGTVYRYARFGVAAASCREGAASS